MDFQAYLIVHQAKSYVVEEEIPMFCSQCGTQIPDNSKFCSNCGYAVPTKDFNLPGSKPIHTELSTQSIQN